jgi:cyanate permease
MGKKVRGKAMRFPVGVFVGAVCGLVVLVMSVVILSKMVQSERIDENAVGWYLMGGMFLSSVIGCVTSCKAVKRRKNIVCFSAAGALLLLLAICNVLLFGGDFQGWWPVVLTVFAGSGMIVILEIVGNGRRSNRMKNPIFVKLNKR